MESWEPAECRQCGNTAEDGVRVCETCRMCEDHHDHALSEREDT